MNVLITRNYTSASLFFVAQTAKRRFLITRLKLHSKTGKCWKYLQSNSLSSLINRLSRWIICLMYDYNLVFWMGAINLNNGCGWTIILYVWHAFCAVCRTFCICGTCLLASLLKRKRKGKSAGFPHVCIWQIADQRLGHVQILLFWLQRNYELVYCKWVAFASTWFQEILSD